MKTVKIDTYSISYTEHGEGSPLIFIHGRISDYRTWENQIEAFAKHFHVIAYSRRFHYPNLTKAGNSDYTVLQHSKDLAGFIKALNLGAVHIVGSSYGAYTGLLTAMRYPNLIKTLVLGEPPVIPLIISNVKNPLKILSLLLRDFATGHSFLKFGIFSMEPAKKQLKKGNFKEGARRFTNGVLGKGGFENLPGEAKEDIMDNIPALQAELNGPGVTEEFHKEEGKNLNVPTLLLYGENSPKFFHAVSDKLFNLLPNSQKAVIPDASHDMHAQNSKVYNETILRFLFKHTNLGYEKS